jgi:hypothetical protein
MHSVTQPWEVAMSKDWVTVEITRSADLEVDAGAIEGWEEDIPQITIEAITE